MQEHHKRVGLVEGVGRTVVIFTVDGKNPEGLENFSVSYYPRAAHLYLQHGGGNKLPLMVNGIEEIRLLREASGKVLQDPSTNLPEREDSGSLLISYEAERVRLLIQRKDGNRLPFVVDGLEEIRLLREASGKVLRYLG